MTFTNVTTGSGATISVFAVLSTPGPALCSAASLRVPAAEHAVCTQLTAPPTLPRLTLGLPPGWYALWQSQSGVGGVQPAFQMIKKKLFASLLGSLLGSLLPSLGFMEQ